MVTPGWSSSYAAPAARYCLACSGTNVHTRAVAVLAAMGCTMTHKPASDVTMSSTSGAVPNGNLARSESQVRFIQVAGATLLGRAPVRRLRPASAKSNSDGHACASRAERDVAHAHPLVAAEAGAPDCGAPEPE